MANIEQHLAKILSAIYGEEVRGSIHDAIAAMNAESSQAIQDASNAKDSAKNSAEAAAASEKNAKGSAAEAKASEQNAKGSAAEAEESEAGAKQYAANAENSAKEADVSASEAFNSAQTTHNLEQLAESYIQMLAPYYEFVQELYELFSKYKYDDPILDSPNGSNVLDNAGYKLTATVFGVRAFLLAFSSVQNSVEKNTVDIKGLSETLLPLAPYYEFVQELYEVLHGNKIDNLIIDSTGVNIQDSNGQNLTATVYGFRSYIAAIEKNARDIKALSERVSLLEA